MGNIIHAWLRCPSRRLVSNISCVMHVWKLLCSCTKRVQRNPPAWSSSRIPFLAESEILVGDPWFVHTHRGISTQHSHCVKSHKPKGHKCAVWALCTWLIKNVCFRVTFQNSEEVSHFNLSPYLAIAKTHVFYSL